MANALQILNYENYKIRTIEKDEQIWFVAKDVCDILGLSNSRKAIKSLDNDEKMTVTQSYTHSGKRGGAQYLSFISEFGVYRLIMRSNKPDAKKFQRWLAHEVIPDLIQHGMYISDKVRDKMQADPEAFAKIVEKYFAEKEKNKLLQEQIEKDLPYTTVGKIVLASKDAIPYTDGALLLAQQGFDTGRNKLLKLGRDLGILCKQKNRWNQPSQKGIEKGVVNLEIGLIDGVKLQTKTMLTPKGIKELERILTELQRPLEALWSQEIQEGENDKRITNF